MTQLAMVQAHALSGHKAQGATVPQATITGLYKRKKADWLGERQPGLNCTINMKNLGWFYTAMSRVQSRYGLRVEAPFVPTKHICAERTGVNTEMARLAVLHARTKKAISATTPHEKHVADGFIEKAQKQYEKALRKFNKQRQQQRGMVHEPPPRQKRKPQEHSPSTAGRKQQRQKKRKKKMPKQNTKKNKTTNARKRKRYSTQVSRQSKRR